MKISLIQINLRVGCVVFVLVRFLKVPGIQITDVGERALNT